MKEKINDLIFKELVKRGYSLRGNTRVWNIADSKLWYLTPKQAQAYLDFIDSTEYQKDISPKEWTLLKKYLDDIVKMIGKKPVNIIDLGCGDGRKAKFLIEGLINKKVRYYPIDISGHMVKKAMDNILKLKKDVVVDFKYNISDFENLENITPLLRPSIYEKNFFLLLGNTLGNFEIHEILYEITSSMQKGDLLMIGNGINNLKVEEDIVKSCKENKFLDAFFLNIPISLGMNKKYIEWDVRFLNSRLEFYYKIKKDLNVGFQKKELYMKEGDELVVGFAYHYQKEELVRFLKIYFDRVVLKTADDGSYALAICEK